MGTETKIRFTITPRRISINPVKKRENYIKRLEAVVEQLDLMINNPRLPRKLRLRAIEVLNKTIHTCYNLVSDIEVENLEDEFEKIKEENQRGTEQNIGYKVQEDPSK